MAILRRETNGAERIYTAFCQTRLLYFDMRFKSHVSVNMGCEQEEYDRIDQTQSIENKNLGWRLVQLSRAFPGDINPILS